MRPIVIVGAGGMGREALAWVIDAFPDRDVAGFLDDGLKVGQEVADGHAVVGGTGWLDAHEADVVLAVGSPAVRRDLAERIASGRGALLTLVHPTAHVGPGVSLGPGTVIAPQVTLTRDVTCGEAVIVNYGARVGHDARIGDHVFIGPGANLAGNVTILEGAEVGIGAAVVQDVTIGARSRIGAGAAVIDDIPPGMTAVGVPCRPLERD